MLQIAVALIALIVALHFAARVGLTLEAVIKRIEGDPNWRNYLDPGKIGDLGRDE